MFKVFGVDKQNGKSFILTWEKGKLTGDEFIVEEFKQRLKSQVEVSVPGGPYWSGKKILKSDQATFLLLYQMYGEVELVEGELKALPSVPEGAIP